MRGNLCGLQTGLEMKVVLYYMATNETGTSGRIVTKLKEELKFAVEYRNIMQAPNISEIATFDIVIFLIATYGDQELQDDIERFLLSINSSIKPGKYATCELGNYYGYEDFTTGAGSIVDNYLSPKGWVCCMPLTSVDTLPLLDWKAVDRWIHILNSAYAPNKK